MNSLVGEYFMYHNLQNYSLAGHPEEAFRKCCMTGIMSNVLLINTERSHVNETNSDKKEKSR